MATNPHKNYLQDLGQLIYELGIEAKEKRDQLDEGTEKYLLQTGRLQAFLEVISLMQDQAQAFDIPLEDIKLSEIDPYRELI